MKVYKQARCLLALLAISMTYGNLYAQEPEIFVEHEISDGNVCGESELITINDLPAGYTVEWSVLSGTGQIMNSTMATTTISNLGSLEDNEIEAKLYSEGVLQQTLTKTIRNIKPDFLLSEGPIVTCNDYVDVFSNAPTAFEFKW